MNTFGIPESIKELLQTDPRSALAMHQNIAPSGIHTEQTSETTTAIITHTVVDGIERIHYLPRQRRFQTPLLFQHGMWHGAWCWQAWQALFAAWGWESIATSLPGHAGSFTQRPIAACTLEYYLGFVRDEVQRLPYRPVYIGHSMGGALAQWYFKYVGDDFPAAVLVASWSAHDAMADSFPRFAQLVPNALQEALQAGVATPLVSTPTRAARILLSSRAQWTPEALHAQLGPESALVTFQHSPPWWEPPATVKTPLLWLAAEADAVLDLSTAQQSAAWYGAAFEVVEGAGHNVMMEHNLEQTAMDIHSWLLHQNVA